jgi:hypothetical protein
MCGREEDDPSMYDAPLPAPPRRIVTAGDRPLGRGSVALATIGSLLNDAEYALERVVIHEGRGLAYELAVARVDVLREVRDAVTRVEG